MCDVEGTNCSSAMCGFLIEARMKGIKGSYGIAQLFIERALVLLFIQLYWKLLLKLSDFKKLWHETAWYKITFINTAYHYKLKILLKPDLRHDSWCFITQIWKSLSSMVSSEDLGYTSSYVILCLLIFRYSFFLPRLFLIRNILLLSNRFSDIPIFSA